MCLLLFVPESSNMAFLVWHAFAYIVLAGLADRMAVSTPVFAVAVFFFQTMVLTPFVYVAFRVGPWIRRKWSELTDDFLR